MSITELNMAIDKGDLDCARQIFEPLANDLTIPEETRARSAFRLSVAFRNKGDLTAADSLYRFMEKLGNSEEVAITRARAAFNLFESYRKADMPKEATEIYQTMERLPRSDDILLLRAMAGVNLVLSRAEIGDDKGALEVYEAMADIGRTDEINTIRATAASYLLEAYERKDDYQKASDVFNSIQSLGVGDSEDVSVACATACVVMARICLKAGKVDEAKSLYKLVDSLVVKFPYLWERRDEVFTVIYEATGETEF
jgi:tetratricopeptide (TPR) repeat protein